jgi:hypothetical protein
MPDRRALFLSFVLAAGVAASSGAADAPAAGAVPVMFLPPPMEGTISFGVYGAAGKLVRVLHREAGQGDFKVGENGLATSWDGQDDSGKRAPPGKYAVSGWMVGELGVEGVAYHGNDWIKEDSPRYTRVTALKNEGRDEVRVTLRTAEGTDETLAWKLSRDGVAPPAEGVEARVEEGRLTIRSGGAGRPAQLGNGDVVIAAVAGFGNRVWAIVETSGAREVRAYSADGEFLRRLAYLESDPQPQQIAASQWEEMIFLLDENATEQRLRALVLGKAGPPAPAAGSPDAQPAAVSAWTTTYLKRVLRVDTFDAAAAHLGRPKPLKAEASVTIPTRLNELLGGKRANLVATVGVEPRGSVLRTKEGLPLANLTATPNLKWAALVRDGADILLFESDGVVVGEFKIGRLGDMMSFDAGEIELPAPGAPPAVKRKKALRPGDDL